MEGGAYNFGAGDPRKLASPDDWGVERTIRGHALVELLVRAGTSELSKIRQVRIRGARVAGEVDLSHAEVLAAVRLDRCLLEQSVILEFARTRTLRFETCSLVSLKATGASIEGDLRIRRSYVQGVISLIDTRVRQSVVLSGSTIAGDGGRALDADRLRVGGNVFLNRISTNDKMTSNADAFRANGEVRLLGARIDGQLNCSGGRFKNPGKIALLASSAQIGGSVFLSDGFLATGQVRLLSARIGGQLRCSKGRFNCPGDVALSASSAHITGSVSMTNKFHATGEVRLMRTRIGGQLNCTGGRFDNPEGTALNLQTAQANLLMLCNLAFGTAGRFDLVGAKISILADDASLSSVQDVSLRLDGFVYEQIAPKSPKDVGTRLQWLKRQPGGYHPQPFDQLVAVLRRNGQDQEASEVLIAKRRARRRVLQGWWSKRWDEFLDFTVLYGWQAWRPLLLGGAVFLISFVLVSAADATGYVDNFSDATLPYTSFIHTLDVFLPIVDLGVESHWMIDTSNNDAFAWLVMWFLWALKLVGWGTVTLALAALTGVVKRE